jgi:hypothetical protein
MQRCVTTKNDWALGDALEDVQARIGAAVRTRDPTRSGDWSEKGGRIRIGDRVWIGDWIPRQTFCWPTVRASLSVLFDIRLVIFRRFARQKLRENFISVYSFSESDLKINFAVRSAQDPDHRPLLHIQNVLRSRPNHVP